MIPAHARDPERRPRRRLRGRRAGSARAAGGGRRATSATGGDRASTTVSVACVRHRREVDREDQRADEHEREDRRRCCRPARSSRSRARARACQAITIATTASGSVSRNTEPHQKCSSRSPAPSGPSAAIAPPMPDQSAIDFVRRRPRPERGDQRERRRVGHAGREPAADARDEEHRVATAPTRRAATRDRESRARGQHQLAAVAVAERAEPEHRAGEAERVADRDQVEGRLAGVEVLADRRAARRSRPRG